MNRDLDPFATEPIAAPLSATARARKRDLLPALQREMLRRRARRRAAAGGLAATAAAAVVAMGVIATLGARPAPAPPVDRIASNQTANSGEAPPIISERREATSRDGSDRGVTERRGAGRDESRDAPMFRLVRNDPAALDRARIDDRRLVQELRSAGYQAGLVRTDRRVFLVSDQQ